MPQLSDIMEKRGKKKFVKRKYRPWDLTGTDETEAEPTHTETSLADTENTDVAVAAIPVNDEQIVNTPVENTPKPDSVKNIDKEDQVTNREQLDNNWVTNRKQLDNTQVTNGEHSGNTQVTIRQQLDNALDNTSNIKQLMRLAGIQRKILEFLVYVCSVKGSLETGHISTISIAEYAETSIGSIKTSINRLINKGVIKRLPGKTARGGYLNLAITEDVKEVFTDFSLDPRKASNSVDFVQFIRKQLGNNEPLYSSSNITTTKTDNNKNILPDDWEQINYTSLEHIGFTQLQLKQLVNLTTPETVQESIYHFAYGLEHNPKFKKYTEPLNVFMGVLRKGQLWTEQNYVSPQEVAQKRLLEKKKAERERLKKLADEAFQLAREEWVDGLDDTEKEKIAPAEKKRGEAPQSVRLSLHFKEHIWPTLKADYLIDGK